MNHSRRLAVLGCALIFGVLLTAWVARGRLLSFARHADSPVPREPSAEDEPDGSVVVCFGRVDVEGGCTALSPVQPGRVAAVLVREGDQVEANAPLLRLEDRTATAVLAEARAAEQGARARLDQAKKGPDLHRVRRRQQQAAITAAEKRFASAQELFEHKQELQKSNIVNVREVAAAREQLKELTALLQVEREKLAELDLLDPQDELRQAEAEAARQQARVDQAAEALAECTLKAPRAGTIVRLHVSAGDMFGPTLRPPALLFAPDEPRIVRAEIDQEFQGQLAVGRRALIEDETNPRARFRGRITRLSDWYLPRRDLLREPSRFNDLLTLECIVTPDAEHPPLRIGQRVRVRVLQADPAH